MKRLTSVLTIVVCLSPHWLSAQRPPQALRIYVLEGNGAVNNVRTRRATVPLIEVRDSDDLPVAGVDVVFKVLPTSGPGAVFLGLQSTYATKTNSQGQAVAAGFQPNNQTGTFEIFVTATLGDRTGEVTISQTNSTEDFASTPPRRSRKKLWIILAIAGGAGAAAGIYFGTRQSDTSPGSGVTLIPGPITIGGPR